MQQWEIPRRTWSEATYRKRNPGGDPFRIKEQLNRRERELKGFGLGLNLGEGTRSSTDAVRLGNTNPKIIKIFLNFLVGICGIDLRKLRFGLQIFNGGNPPESLHFWLKEFMGFYITRDQFQKVVVTAPRGRGLYRNKIRHGVLTGYYCNTKLRSSLEKMIE